MRRGRGLIISGVILLAVSVVAVVVAVGLFFATALGGARDDENAPQMQVPGDKVVELHSGDYVIYADPDRTVDRITVTTASGTEVATTPDSVSSLTQGGRDYRSVATFTAPEDGAYTVAVDGEAGGSVVIGRAFTEYIAPLLGSGILGILGVLALVVGLPLLIVGIVRRRAGRRQVPPPGYPPFGGGLVFAPAPPAYPPGPQGGSPLVPPK